MNLFQKTKKKAYAKIAALQRSYSGPKTSEVSDIGKIAFSRLEAVQMRQEAEQAKAVAAENKDDPQLKDAAEVAEFLADLSANRARR